MKAIFLDVDGVLNCSTSKSYCHDDICGVITGIDSDKVKRLARIVEATDAKIILSSDWKVGWEKRYITRKPSHAKYLDNHLYKKGKLIISDKTPNTHGGYWRGEEILTYLRSHPDITDYVILDDTFFEDFSTKEIEEHLVLTNYKLGLTDADVTRAIRILRGNE
jgi:hypothetical protein